MGFNWRDFLTTASQVAATRLLHLARIRAICVSVCPIS
jgi:hypothetical protein